MSRRSKDRNKSGKGKARRSESPTSGGGEGLVFRDRSGKLHGRGGGGGAHSPAPRHEGGAKPHGTQGRRFERPESFQGHKQESRDNRPSERGPSRFKPRPGERKFDREGRRTPRRPERPRRRGPATLKATVDKNQKGFGFLIFEDRTFEDAFIPPREAETLFHGDRVEVEIDSRGEVESVRVLEHRFRELVGRFTPHPAGPARGGWVVYERKRAREEVYIDKAPGNARTGDWVQVKLHFHEKGPFRVTGEIVAVYGAELPASADLPMVAAEYNLIEEHSQAAVHEAEGMRLEIPGKDLQGREDLRAVPFITIDGETARDFDDAVYVERTRSGFILWVAIADVSHYVKEGSALDREAFSRGTSVYFPERAFHMLPRALSENLCSLRPDEPRLTLVSRMEFDRSGERVRTEVMEAVIQSKRRATYNQIQAESERHGKDPSWEYAPHFELYRILRKVRADRGSIDFDLPEAEVVVKPTGEVVSIKNRPRLDAHRLIEEFMIAANEAVTQWMLEKSWPFVYRVHDEPARQSLEKFQAIATQAGVPFSLDRGASPKFMAELVRRLEGHPAQTLLNMALLRSMKQAVYSSTHGIHYGLASEGYTHFTSPIRRYPDLVVHRLLRQALRTEKRQLPPLKEQERTVLEEKLTGICEHCSYRERLAADADREATRLKQVRAMIPHLGEEMDGKIMGMLESGFFTQVEDPYVEGMVPRDSLMDDYYEFNEERMIFVGKRTKRMFKVGDIVRIRVLRADIDRRQIDFGLAEFDVEALAARAERGGERGGARGRSRDGERDRGGRDKKPGRFGDQGGGNRPGGFGGGGRGRRGGKNKGKGKRGRR